MRIEKAYPGQVIQLGRRGENKARQIEFDLSDWLDQYKEGRAELLYQRFGDSRPYIRDLEQRGTKALWEITDWDTEVARPGKCELRWYCGDTLAKSQSWPTSVAGSLGTPSSTAPQDPEPGWVDTVLAAGAGIKIHADEAAKSAEKAKQSALRAEEFSGSAQGALESTKAVEARVKEYATAVEEAETNIKEEVNAFRNELPAAVEYVEQSLTEEQQTQARENIGAQPKSVVLRITYGEDEVFRYSHTLEELWAAYQEGCIITCEISIRQGVYSLKTASETEFVFDRFESDSYITLTYDGGSYRITSELIGRVVSVNGKSGDVELTAEDVGALPADADVKNSMIVNVSQDEDGNFVADKTSTEIYEFVQNDGWAVAKVFDGVLSLVSCQPDSCSFAVSFIYGGYADGVVIEVDAQGFVTPNNAALEKLPNPSALTFTGAVEATYDGSNPVTVEIPQGGSGGAEEIYVGTEKPTDPNIKLWLNPEGEVPSVGGGGDDYGKLIASATLTETAGVVELTGLNLGVGCYTVIIRGTGGASAGSGLTVSLNGTKKDGYTGGYGNNASERSFALLSVLDSCVYGASAMANGGKNNYMWESFSLPITSVSVWSPYHLTDATKYFSVGTIVEIYKGAILGRL